MPNSRTCWAATPTRTERLAAALRRLTPACPDADGWAMTFLVLIAGTIIYLITGAAIDAVFPGLGLLGLTLQGVIFSTICLLGTIWAAAKLDLFDL